MGIFGFSCVLCSCCHYLLTKNNLDKIYPESRPNEQIIDRTVMEIKSMLSFSISGVSSDSSLRHKSSFEFSLSAYCSVLEFTIMQIHILHSTSIVLGTTTLYSSVLHYWMLMGGTNSYCTQIQLPCD